MRHPWWRRASRARRLMFLLVIPLLLLTADYALYPPWAPIGGRSRNTGENGLWLRYRWYFGERTDADHQRLARELRDRQIRYAYFHVRFITREGMLRFRYPDSARRLVASLRRGAPDTFTIAWVYAGNQRGEGSVDLSDPKVRATMVGEAVWLADACGFDGVQWDYELCADGDPHFLLLMEETRAALPPGKILSAAVPMWLPAPARQRLGWSEDYFARVAATCDQMAVMCYDSGLYLPRAYVWLVRQQAVHVTRAVARGNGNCRVLLGIPTYGPGGPGHHAPAESIRMALKGVREGLDDPRAQPAVFAGVAPFADYTTQPEEWETYRRLWLQR